MSLALVLDAGALIALDRNDREVWAMLRVAADEGGLVQVPAGVIGQSWRNGSRQALLVRALRHCDEVVLDGTIARAAGLLCGTTGTADVIDATVALSAAASSQSLDTSLLTSDPGDLRPLVEALGAEPRIVVV